MDSSVLKKKKKIIRSFRNQLCKNGVTFAKLPFGFRGSIGERKF